MLEVAGMLGVDYINVNNEQIEDLSGGPGKVRVAAGIEGYEVVPGALVFNQPVNLNQR